MNDINKAQFAAHENSKRHGFWDGGINDPKELIIKLALIGEEVFEIIRAVRSDPHERSAKVPELSVEEEECADVFLRLADYCAAREIDLSHAAELKHKYNLNRPEMHGKKV